MLPNLRCEVRLTVCQDIRITDVKQEIEHTFYTDQRPTQIPLKIVIIGLLYENFSQF